MNPERRFTFAHHPAQPDPAAQPVPLPGRYGGSGSSRRAFLRMTAGAAAVAGLATLPIGGRASVAGAQSPPAAVSAYHDVTGTEHQHRFDDLSRRGFRLISLSVYGDPASTRYAAVWVQRGGPAWVAIHDANSSAFQTFYNTWVARGYRPLLVTATGPASNTVFAGVFEQGASPGWVMRLGVADGPESDPNSFQGLNKYAREHNLILRSAAVYGDTGRRLYAGIWDWNADRTHWTARDPEEGVELQRWFDAHGQIPARLGVMVVGGDGRCLPVYRDDAIGPWVARAGMTSGDYQAEFDRYVAQGYYPVSVQAAGAGASTRFAAIFARQDAPTPRRWTATGSPVAALAGLDRTVQTFMQGNGVRAGTLAVMKAGRVVFARAYTWAEAGYPVTQPTTLFRLASVSKAFTSAAVRKAYEQGLLAPDTPVFPLLGITSAAAPGQRPDPRVNTITIQHIVDHVGGWDTGVSWFDPIFATRHIARALALGGPPTKRDIARYMYGEPLQFTPGSPPGGGFRYSNLGYLLLSLAIEKVSGRPFIDFLRGQVLAPLGIADCVVAATQREGRLPNEALYHQFGLGLSALSPTTETLAPLAHGGEGYITEVADSTGGLAATATAVARLIGVHAVWGVGPRTAGAARSGSFAGTSSLAVSRGDGVDYAYIFNTRDFDPTAGDALGTLQAGIDAVLSSARIA